LDEPQEVSTLDVSGNVDHWLIEVYQRPFGSVGKLVHAVGVGMAFGCCFWLGYSGALWLAAFGLIGTVPGLILETYRSRIYLRVSNNALQVGARFHGHWFSTEHKVSLDSAPRLTWTASNLSGLFSLQRTWTLRIESDDEDIVVEHAFCSEDELGRVRELLSGRVLAAKERRGSPDDVPPSFAQSMQDRRATQSGQMGGRDGRC
jgi:hypothetical protein